MMQGSAYIGHLGPIPLYIHWSSILMVAMAWYWTGGTTDLNSFDPVRFMSFLIVLLFSIVLHELGHGFAARMVARNESERTVTITLWAFGGVCMSNSSQRALPQLWIVLAGPLVSLLLWLSATAVLIALTGNNWAEFARACISPYMNLVELRNSWPLWAVQLLGMVCMLNFGLLVFNMIPIYPFDGGQALYNGIKLITKRYDLARSLTMAVSVTCAVAYFSWRWQQDGQPSIYLACILGWALYTGWVSLTQYRM